MASGTYHLYVTKLREYFSRHWRSTRTPHTQSAFCLLTVNILVSNKFEMLTLLNLLTKMLECMGLLVFSTFILSSIVLAELMYIAIKMGTYSLCLTQVIFRSHSIFTWKSKQKRIFGVIDFHWHSASAVPCSKRLTCRIDGCRLCWNICSWLCGGWRQRCQVLRLCDAMCQLGPSK